MTDQFSSISVGRKVGGIGLSMDTRPAPYFFLTNILKYRLDRHSGEFYWKVEPERQFQDQKWGVFSTALLVRTSVYSMNLKLFDHGIQYPKIPPIYVGKYAKS